MAILNVILRYFCEHRERGLAARMLPACERGAARVYGDGQQTRDVSYVGDVVDANQTLLIDGSADDVLNIGSSDTISIQMLAEVVRDGVAPELAIEHEAARQANAKYTHASVAKPREAIGYEPSRTITEGVGEFIEWDRENWEWYEPLVRKS